MAEVIHCAGVRKRFGPVVAVDNLGFTLRGGEVLALLGPSGCGKTTALRLIAGFERPEHGTIAIGGVPVAGERVFVPPEQRKIGMVFQNYALFPHLDVAANIAYGLPRRMDRGARVAEVIELTGLDGLEQRMPHELSGGQQQRVALARALAPRPDVLLLDEPFSNLDAALRRRVRLEVQAILREARATAVFVTHDQAEAMSLADQLAVMQAGRLLQIGRPQQLYRFPATHEVAALLGDTNWLPGEADGASVTCALGRLELASPIYGRVEVLLRPEAVTLTPDVANGYPVVHAEFLGHEQLVTLTLADGTTLRARHHPFDIVVPGMEVGLSVRRPVVAFQAQRPD
jgi:iron(III) transport system ATP-binding protein